MDMVDGEEGEEGRDRRSGLGLQGSFVHSAAATKGKGKGILTG